jgi:pyroglutamyl-peptidase
MDMTRAPIILASGFSVFPGAPENPTAWAIAELERERWQPHGAKLITRTFPVRYDIWQDVKAVIDDEKPDAVIGFGLSAKATGFTLETIARNQLGKGRPDAGGTLAESDRLIDDGTSTYASGLPLTEIEIALKKSDLPLTRSEDAGDYICNLFFYRLMKHHTERATPRFGGFIHVPYLDEQLPRLERAGLPTTHLKTLTQPQLLQGMKTVISVVANALH